jgi:hypothetical protein
MVLSCLRFFLGSHAGEIEQYSYLRDKAKRLEGSENEVQSSKQQPPLLHVPLPQIFHGFERCTKGTSSRARVEFP